MLIVYVVFQGKGLMDTYWLTCKEGGAPHPHPGAAAMADIQASMLDDSYDAQPAFLRRLRHIKGERYT